MAKRSELALFQRPPPRPYVGVTQYVDGRRDVPHPAGVYTVDGRAHVRVAELEGALLRVAALCAGRPDVLDIISGVLVEDPRSGRRMTVL
jgi:hypothetical protein